MNLQDIFDLMGQLNGSVGQFKADYNGRLDVIERALAMQLAPGGGLSSESNPKAGGYKNLGEFAQSVAMAMRPGGRIDERLLKVQAAATGANETVPSEGGFLVNQDMSNALLKSVFDTAVVATRCNRFPISANANGIKLNAVDESSRANGSRWGGVQTYWAAEADTVTKSKPKFRQMELSLHKLFGICYVTDWLC